MRMEESSTILLVAFLVICCASQVRSDASNHRYKAGDPVPFYSSMVGPYHNPRYHVKEKNKSLVEVLNGDRLVSAPYKIDFLVEKDIEVACKKKLRKEEVSQFRAAVAQDYYFQMYYDDLPVWAFIGTVHRPSLAETNDYKYLLFTDIEFEILYNKEHVIEINAPIHTNFVIDLTGDKEVDVEFRYTVKWIETNIPFKKRMEKYTMPPNRLMIHWFTLINSCLTVLIRLGCFVMFYVRVLKKDINNMQMMRNCLIIKRTRWKNIHGDVFRYPMYKSLFAVVVGSGTQLFILVRNLLLTGCLFSGPLFLTFFFLNTVAVTYRATAALPLGTILVLFSIWVLVASPLHLLGGIAAKNNMAVAGILPLIVIDFELGYLLASVWSGHPIYPIYAILLLPKIMNGGGG
ncbi:unnamed protein product [Camellia sinensis]